MSDEDCDQVMAARVHSQVSLALSARRILHCHIRGVSHRQSCRSIAPWCDCQAHLTTATELDMLRRLQRNAVPNHQGLTIYLNDPAYMLTVVALMYGTCCASDLHASGNIEVWRSSELRLR